MSLVSTPRPLKVSGAYDRRTKTWSNREFEAAADKKHNEDM